MKDVAQLRDWHDKSTAIIEEAGAMDSTDVSNAQQLRRQQLNSHVASGLAPAGGAAVRPTPAQATAPATAAVRPGEMPGMADPRAAAASQLPVRSPTDPLSLVAPHNFPPHHEPAPAATRPPERSVCKGCGALKSGPGHGKIRGTATFAVHGKCTQPCKCGRSRAEHRLDPFGVLCKKQRKEPAAAAPTAAAAAATTATSPTAAATAAPVHPRPYVAGDSFHHTTFATPIATATTTTAAATPTTTAASPLYLPVVPLSDNVATSINYASIPTAFAFPAHLTPEEYAVATRASPTTHAPTGTSAAVASADFTLILDHEVAEPVVAAAVVAAAVAVVVAVAAAAAAAAAAVVMQMVAAWETSHHCSQ